MLSQEEIDLSTMWVGLGVARDCYDKAFKGYKTAHFMLQRDEMQRMRDKIERRLEMMRELEEIDHE